MSEATTKEEIEKRYTVEKKYYRAKELAVYLGVSITTVWNYAKEGRLTPKKLSNHATVFDIKEVETLFNSVEVA